MAGQGRWIAGALLLAMAACTPFPDIDAPQPAQSGQVLRADVPAYPRIVPLDAALGAVGPAPGATAPEAEALSARAADLRRRAALLRQRDI